MSREELLHNNELETDFKASSKAASLVAQGVDSSIIEIVPIGGSSRAYAKEIESTSSYISDISGEERIRIDINREGLYDMLPEGLFHTLATGTEILDEDIMIQDIRKKRKEERDARRFFMPFEIELNQLRMMLELYENRLDMQTSHNEMSNLLSKSWTELHLLNSRQRVIWLHFIPEIQHHKNDINYLEKFFQLLFNIPISIRRKYIKKKIDYSLINITSAYKLGNISLGIDSITQKDYEAEIEVIEIKLGPTYAQLLNNYLPNQKDIQIIQNAVDYLIPAQTDVEIIYDLLPEVKNSYIYLDSTKSNTVLGYTSYL